MRSIHNTSTSVVVRLRTSVRCMDLKRCLAAIIPTSHRDQATLNVLVEVLVAIVMDLVSVPTADAIPAMNALAILDVALELEKAHAQVLSKVQQVKALTPHHNA